LGIGLLFCGDTAVFMIISIIFSYLLPMTRDKHEALREAIRKKGAGEEFDEKIIEDIVRNV
jgi:Na+/melibiose symporter-like transporter